MGGEDSGCTETTTNVFLEVALFDPVRVAATGRKLGILSDARYRFERGLDPVSAEWGVEVATRLILELCGGEASEPVSAGTLPRERRALSLRPARVKELGGVDVPAAEQRRILETLGFEIEDAGGKLGVTVPGWRTDVEHEACLVEEVLRIHGFEHLPLVVSQRDTALPHPAINLAQRRAATARLALAHRGLNEAVTFSFLPEPLAELFGGGAPALKLDNPISTDLAVMRPTALPNLLTGAARNQDRGIAEVALFEIGPQYGDDSPEGQSRVACGVRCGTTGPRHWRDGGRAPDAFDAKADALAALAACGAPVENLQVSRDAPAWYHPGKSGVLRLGPNALAHFGEVHPRFLKALDLKAPAVAFEVFLDRVPAPKSKGKGKGGKSGKAPLVLSAFQPVERDFAFLVDEEVPAESLLRAAKGAEKALVTRVDLFDAYSGKGIEPGKKSLAIAVTLQPTERTMTDQEIEQVSAKIVAQVEKVTGGSLRG